MTEKSRKADRRVTVLLAVMLVLICIAALAFGSAQMDLQCLIGGILKRDGFETESTILYSLRFPRLLGAILAGVGLSCSGVLLQAVTGNSLASPNIIGVNAGAGFAVILLMSFFPAAVGALPFAAFIGAFCTTMLILFLCSKISFSKSTVILAGVAVTALLNAAISLISYSDTDLISLYRDFSVGGLSSLGTERLIVPSFLIFTGTVAALVAASRIDALCLGDSIALSLGIKVKPLRIFCLIIASLLAGSVVSFAGLLGFVGLVVPHIAKRLSGENSFRVLMNSSLIGACLVTLSDLFGRIILSPTEVPVGIIMSFIGAPFLFYLLLRRKRNA